MVAEYGYEYDAVPDRPLFDRTKKRTTRELFNGAICLRSGRDALKSISAQYSPTVALLPALSCDSMVLPFEVYGHTVKYYRLNSDYSVSLESLAGLIDETPPSKPILFLYMDYFGRTAISDGEKERLRNKHPQIVWIEDRTHNLFAENKGKFTPDYTAASLRKWAEIPDGGLLWTKEPLRKCNFSDSPAFSETRLKAQWMRHEFLACGDRNLKTEYRKIFSTVSDLIDGEKEPARMSLYAYEMAKRIDWFAVMKRRRDNAETLIRLLKASGARLIQDVAGASDVYVAILIENRDYVQRKLSEMGIFCTIIWPLTEIQKKSCPIAKYTEEHMLAIYCDQRYTTRDMEFIASNIIRFMAGI